jgi:hypothetical protein
MVRCFLQRDARRNDKAEAENYLVLGFRWLYKLSVRDP